MTIMNVKMSERTSVRDHMIYMIEFFNEIKIFRVEINKGT